MKLEQLRTWSPIGPWRATVTINAMTGRQAGRHTSLPYETLFQVTAEWIGPPPAFSVNRGATNVSAQDTVIVRSHEWAQMVAAAAVEELKNGRVPDMRELAGPGSVSNARAFA
jgi:hypothetical protein